ncbi:MAG: HEPN domain-containing protein [Candidatus Freyarchaeota archaeon]
MGRRSVSGVSGMVNNFDIASGWIRLAFEDWRVIGRLSVEENRGAIVYHVQQFVEKLLRAVISVLGFEPRQVHNPSWQLDEILSDVQLGEIEEKISPDDIALLEDVSSVAKTLEDERTRPRYGVRHASGVTTPNEYYSEDAVRQFLDDARFIAGALVRFFEKSNLCSKMRLECEFLGKIGRGEA